MNKFLKCIPILLIVVVFGCGEDSEINMQKLQQFNPEKEKKLVEKRNATLTDFEQQRLDEHAFAADVFQEKWAECVNNYELRNVEVHRVYSSRNENTVIVLRYTFFDSRREFTEPAWMLLDETKTLKKCIFLPEGEFCLCSEYQDWNPVQWGYKRGKPYTISKQQ